MKIRCRAALCALTLAAGYVAVSHSEPRSEAVAERGMETS